MAASLPARSDKMMKRTWSVIHRVLITPEQGECCEELKKGNDRIECDCSNKLICSHSVVLDGGQLIAKDCAGDAAGSLQRNFFCSSPPTVSIKM